jgi:L-alanine-DL-glutamate epimerase-like enolase superfamily enzyme
VKIASVRAVPVNLTFRGRYPPNSFGEPQAHKTVVVLIETDAGEIGIGEATPSLLLEQGLTQGYLLDVINDYYAPALVGRDPSEFSALHELMDRQIYGNVGLEACRAAIDCALHDAVGKALELPAVALVGGKIRDVLPAMGGIGIGSPAEMAADAQDLMEKLPAKFLKVKIGGGRIHGTWPSRVDPRLDIERLRRVREVLDEDVTIIADANQSYTPAGAIGLINSLDIDPCMFEQPVDEGDLNGLAHVAKSVKSPIVADESAYTPARLLRVLSNVPVAAVNIKPSRTSGFHGSVGMIRMVEAAGLKCSIDCVLESRIGGAMIAQLAAAVREDAYLATTATLISDFWLNDQDYWTGGAAIGDGGTFVLADGPGLGLTISPTFLEMFEGSQNRQEVRF